MEIYIDDTCLRVHTDGTIERLDKRFKTKKWKFLKENNQRYSQIQIGDKMYLIHRIIAFVYLNHDLDDYSKIIDHINRNKKDNRVENLRVVTQSQNVINSHIIDNAKGYYKCSDRNGFQVSFMLNGKQLTKRFKTEEEARAQYLEWIQIHRL